jgi:hypothetical protein
MSNVDPAVIVARSLRMYRYAESGGRPPAGPVGEEDRSVAADMLAQVRAAGWRIVLDGPCKNPDAGMACGCQNVRFTEEWTP